jgi:PKD repeat protein
MLGYTRVTVDPSTGTATAEVIRVADVSSDLKSLTTVYPPETIFETVVMTIHAPPVAAFSAEPISGKAPLTVRFADASIGPVTSYAWDFDNDGSVDSTEKSPAWTYTTAGTCSVRLVVRGPNGTDDEIRTDYITVTGGGIVPAPEFPVPAFPVLFTGVIGLISALIVRSRRKSG